MKNVENKTIKVLFGFDEVKFITECKRILNAFGYELEYVQKYSKQSIEDFLKTNTDYDIAVLKEIMGRTKYTDEELAHLCDLRDLNIIPVLGESHRGTPYMQTLYNAGITSALFTMATKGSDATPEHVVKLILNKRTREKARDYYKISTGTLGIDVFTPQQVQDAIAAIMDTSWGKTTGDRFLKVCGTIKTRQAYQLINELTPDLRKELEKYDEFYTILLKLRDKGVAINKKSWVAGMEAVLKKKKLEGKKKSILEIKEDQDFIQQEKKEEADRAALKAEYMQTGGTYAVPPVHDDYADVSGLNTSGTDIEEESNYVPNNLYGSYYQQPYQATPAAGIKMPEQPPVQPPIQPQVSQMRPMPDMTDWKAMKKWQKEQAKLMKKAEKDAKRSQRISQKSAPKVEKPRKNVRIAEDSKNEMKPFFTRIVVTVAILAVVAIIVTVILASTKVSEQQMANQQLKNEVLTEQMNDLAELRGDMSTIDISVITPKITTISNGQSIMGLEAMDTINSSNEMFYVISLSGEIFTFENGGATSEEIDLNSMYRCQLLSSGRFAFIQL